MRKARKKRVRTVGLPPGSLVHVGEPRTGEVRITVIDYDEAQVRERAVRDVAACAVFRDKPTVTWINVDGLHDVRTIQELGTMFNIHPLILEDILNTEQRPKLEDHEDYLYVVVKMLYRGGGENGPIVAEQVSFILGPNYVISFQERPGDVFDPIRERIRGGKGRVRKAGADYLAYCLIDAVVDHYFLLLEHLDDRINDTEEGVIARPTRETLHQIHDLRKELLLLRRSAWPLREVIRAVETGESKLIQPASRIYLRDLYDHAVQIAETVSIYQELVTGMLDTYLSSLSYRQNDVMKVLTIIATIFIPLTFLAGVYGMNFHYMPELGWRWGYFGVLGVMLVTVGVMLVLFRRKGWL